MSAKFTPGPWATTTRQGSWDWVVYQVTDPNIEICQPFHDDTEENEIGEANARLIAAAPDMLAALREIAAEAGVTTGEMRAEIERHQRIISLALAVIAKAEGAHENR